VRGANGDLDRLADEVADRCGPAGDADLRLCDRRVQPGQLIDDPIGRCPAPPGGIARCQAAKSHEVVLQDGVVLLEAADDDQVLLQRGFAYRDGLAAFPSITCGSGFSGDHQIDGIGLEPDSRRLVHRFWRGDGICDARSGDGSGLIDGGSAAPRRASSRVPAAGSPSGGRSEDGPGGSSKPSLMPGSFPGIARDHDPSLAPPYD
jgi:hypothetical protein